MSTVRNRKVISISIRCSSTYNQLPFNPNTIPVISISIRCSSTYNQFTFQFPTLYLSLMHLWQKDERSLPGKIQSLEFSINFPAINLVTFTNAFNFSPISCFIKAHMCCEFQFCALGCQCRRYWEQDNRCALVEGELGFSDDQTAPL
jgi:hypothetical protein